MKDHSQFGESQIIVDVVAAIEKNGFEVPRVACEFGAGDGFVLSNIRGLMEEGWEGIQLDREKSSNIEVLQASITAENINIILREELCGGREMGVLSIDVDGSDYWIWKAMTLNPAIVCIEFNPTIFGRKTIKYDPMHRWTGTDSYCGASFQAILDLGNRKGYKAIAKTPCNLIFARADFWPDPEPELTHEPVAVWPASEKEFEEV